MDIVIGIILIASAIFLIVAVLLQSGKDKGLSGALSGSSSDTFYGKNKGNQQPLSGGRGFYNPKQGGRAAGK